LQTLDLRENQLTELPETIGRLTQLQSLDLSDNKLTTLPESIGDLTRLQTLDLRKNQLTELPETIGRLTQLHTLDLSYNQLTTLPESIGHLTQLQELVPSNNQLTALPKSIGQLTQLQELVLSNNQLTALPKSIGQLTQLTELNLADNKLTALPDSLGFLTNLKKLSLGLTYGGNPLGRLSTCIRRLNKLEQLAVISCELTVLPSWINELTQLQDVTFYDNQLSELPEAVQYLRLLNRLDIEKNVFTYLPPWISELKNLKTLQLSENSFSELPPSLAQLKHLKVLLARNCKITHLPPSLAQLEHLEHLDLNENSLNPALQSAYEAGLDELMAYLRSLADAEPLHEAKLVLVGEGKVGKTTLLKALKGREGEAPKKGETTTHGVEIDIDALHLPHPELKDVNIQLNTWDFGGQDVYRVTHQFFFSRRSLYLLVWEPRMGVQQCQVEDWLNMIRLRVGNDARVIIISTHCKTGERIARIDRDVFQRDYSAMIVGFHEVDSLVEDIATGEMIGIAELKKIIAEQAAQLEQMGMGFNRNWKAARDELIKHPDPRISYLTFTQICANHSLNEIDTETLAHLMHDLGYIIHYSDDERLKDDVVLQPEWLTKAIGFVLEDRTTQEMDGILPDSRLYDVWHDHKFENEPRYKAEIYPFFLRLMEKYDVSYRLPDGTGSLVAQHVPQVRPELPWLPGQEIPADLRRIAMVCAMEEDPPGLVPWMIVRTHDYALELAHGDGNDHRLHWQKGMFLCHPPHGDAMLEKRGREFHIYAQAVWPEYFMNVLQHTLYTLITDNWPGLAGRYRFTVPCPEQNNGQPCKGRFNIDSLRQFLAEGDRNIRCQECRTRHSIASLVFGFEDLDLSEQLRDIQARLDGLDSRIANYVMSIMNAIADEAKGGPRLFTLRSAVMGPSLESIIKRKFELQLWCEAEGCQHPVMESGKGIYPLKVSKEWVVKIAPYANFALGVLKTVAPVAGPAINTFFGSDTTKLWSIKDQLDLAKSLLGQLPKEIQPVEHGLSPRGMLRENERTGLLALHSMLKELDPHQERIGLHRISTYTGDYRWLCKEHYEAWQPKIPDVIEG
jgi:Leucine-rich repeat (LRR) protein/GTPase SAR1 family protein